MPSNPLPPLMRGAALNVAARGLTLLLGLALLVAVARLGPQVQGAFALFVAAESVLLTLFSGLGLVLARELSHRGAAPAPLVRALLRSALALGVLAAIVLAGFAAFSRVEPYRHLWLLALAAPLLLWVPTASGLWLGQGRMALLNAPAVAAPALVLLALPVVSTFGAPGVFGVLCAWVLGKGLVALVTGGVALRSVGPATPATGLLAHHWRFVASVGLTNVISLLNLRLTLFLLERVRGLDEAGVYSVAVQLAELLWVLSSAVTLSAYHRIGGSDEAQAAHLTLRALRTGLALALAAAPLLGGAAWYFLPQVLGPAYLGARLPLAVLLPGVALYAAASSLSAFYTNLQGRPQWSARVAGLSLGLTLAIAAWAIPRWGAAGAALATSVAYTVAIGFALRTFLRDQGWGWRVLVVPPVTAQAARQCAPP